MNESIESILFCEGYHDRAFWDGLLLKLGCTSLKSKGGVAVYDRFGEPVVGGQFAYHSKSGKFIRLFPCRSKNNVTPLARIRLSQKAAKPIDKIVLNFDYDVFADGTKNPNAKDHIASVEGMLNRMKIPFERPENEPSVFSIDGGSVKLNVIQWRSETPPSDILPNQQTLERVVCDAILKAHPERAQILSPWLAALPQASREEVKTFAWSHMSGWHASDGCEAFYSRLWEDSKVAEELKKLLEACGAWAVAEELAK